MDREQLIKYLNDMYIRIEEDEIQAILKNAAEVEKILMLLEEYQPESDVKSGFPFIKHTSYLREDVVDHMITCEEVLENVADSENSYVRYTKVV